MARIYAPLVRQASTTTGTGDYTVSGTVTGYVPFSGRCSVGDFFRYMVREVDGSGNPTGAYESGTGTYSAANTIVRTAVLYSSNADAAVNWSAGTRIIDLVSWVDVQVGEDELLTEDLSSDVPDLSGDVEGTDKALIFRAGVPYQGLVSTFPFGEGGAADPLGLWDFWYEWRAGVTGATASDMFAGAAISSGTNTTAIPTTGQAGYNPYGVFLRSGTTANGGYKYQTSSMVADFLGTISHKFRCQFLWRTSFTGRTVRIGYHDSVTNADATDGVYFEIVGDVCTAKTASLSNRTSNATTLTLSLDVAYTFDIAVNAAGTSARFRVYSGTSQTPLLDVTNTATMPSNISSLFGAGIVATESSTTASDIGILYSLGLGTVEGFNRIRGEEPLLAPSAFTVGQWTATAGVESIELNITALPFDGGSAITALQYRLDGGTAVALTGTGTGIRTISGLTGGVEYDVEIRAVNAVGTGAWSDLKARTPTAAATGPVLVQRTILPDGAASRGEFVNANAVFPADVTPTNTIIIYGSSNGTLGTVDSSQAADTPVIFDEEVFGGAAYWTQLGYILNAAGGPTTISMASGGAGVHSLYAEEWANLPVYNAAADVGVQAAIPPTTVSTPNATDEAVGVSFVSWSYFGNGLNGNTQAIPTGFTEGARYTTGAGGNAGRAQLIGGYRAETATGVKSAAWATWEAEFIVSQIMVMTVA